MRSRQYLVLNRDEVGSVLVEAHAISSVGSIRQSCAGGKLRRNSKSEKIPSRSRSSTAISRCQPATSHTAATYFGDLLARPHIHPSPAEELLPDARITPAAEELRLAGSKRYDDRESKGKLNERV